MIHDTENLRSDQIRTADVCVIGSGPGGAVVAKELAEKGLSVIVLESGPRLHHSNSTREPGSFLSRFLQQGGLRAMLGNTFVASMQAEAIGGTSEVNSAILKPMPDAILKEWIENYGLTDLSVQEMHGHYQAIEAELNVRPSEAEALGPKNLVMKRGLEKLGWDSHPLSRAVVNCEGASDCLTACPSGAKRTMSVTYIPKASRAGADIYPSCRARYVLREGKRAVGVRADILHPQTRKPQAEMTVYAKAVVVSAGVMWSPILLRRSGIKGNGWVGRNLCAHIGTAAFGMFDEEINGWWGATQGWGSNEFFHRGMVLEALWSPPAVLATRLPGVGHEYLRELKEFKHYAMVATKPRGVSRGRVVEGLNGQPFCTFRVKQEDADETAMGLKACVDTLFAAGAKRVLPGVFGAPWVMEKPEDSNILLKKRFPASSFEFVANHVFGTCRMGSNPRKSVVDSWSEVHSCKDLFVCDSSIFPTGIVNNPQETIMAFSRRTAHHIAERYA